MRFIFDLYHHETTSSRVIALRAVYCIAQRFTSYFQLNAFVISRDLNVRLEEKNQKFVRQSTDHLKSLNFG